MIYISHRGNLTGRNLDRENSPEYIDEALEQGFDVEVDFWSKDSKYFLGHDYPQYEIPLEWLSKRADRLWVHCKSLDSLALMNTIKEPYHYFFHDVENATLTSKNYIWLYPGVTVTYGGSILCLPESVTSYYYLNDILTAVGICSDVVSLYKEELTQESLLAYGDGIKKNKHMLWRNRDV